MSGAASLPAGFEALEPFVGAWALDSSAARAERRCDSSAAERVAFYEAGKALLPAGLACLDRKPLDAFDDVERRLMEVLLSLAHVAIAVEVQAEDEPGHAPGARHMRITRTPADK